MVDTYATHAKGIRILPGQWRPHYPFEQIAWISPPWPSQEYVWLDFPEAIFADVGLLYLSHVNPQHPVMFPDLPTTPWHTIEDGLCFERLLPNGVKFGGSVRTDSISTVLLELYIHNGGHLPLRDIRLQTCTYLRVIKEFSECTQQNKFVHTKKDGWLSYDSAKDSKSEDGHYRLGWRGGPKVSNFPVMVALSNQPNRLLAMTWGEHTYSLTGNPNHPCIHADPFFQDLDPGKESRISGKLIFFEGSLDTFATCLNERE